MCKTRLIKNENKNGTKIVSVRKEHCDILCVNTNGFQTTGLNITPKLAALIIQELTNYLLEQNNEK